MSKIGDLIKSHNDVFEEWLEDSLTLRNWLEQTDSNGDPVTDDYGDVKRELHPDSPVTTTGRIDHPTEPIVVSDATGSETTIDAEVFVPDDELVTNGGETDSQGRDLPWPTQVEGPDGRLYTVVNVTDQGNGRLLCHAIDTEEDEDGS